MSKSLVDAAKDLVAIRDKHGSHGLGSPEELEAFEALRVALPGKTTPPSPDPELAPDREQSSVTIETEPTYAPAKKAAVKKSSAAKAKATKAKAAKAKKAKADKDAAAKKAAAEPKPYPWR